MIASWLQAVEGIGLVVLLMGGVLLWLNQQWYQTKHQLQWGRIGVLFEWWQRGRNRWVSWGKKGVVVYLVLLVVSGWVVGVIIDDVVQQEPEMVARDRWATTLLQFGSSGELPFWVEAFEKFGDLRVLAGVGVLTVAWLWKRQQRKVSGLTFINFGGALALGVGLQLWLKRPLPSSSESYWHLTNYAFPYLPSLMAVVVYGWLGYWWTRESAREHTINAGTLVTFLVLTISIIGLYLGYAHLTDVVAGIALGVLWLGIPFSLVEEEVVDYREHIREKATQMTPKARLRFLFALTVPVVILTFIQPPIAQDPSYHHFADQRLLFGIPNFFNVLSNLGLLITGIFGLHFLYQQRKSTLHTTFDNPLEERPYFVFFWAIAIAGIGSAYYHFAPDNTHLVWDRLPISFGIMAIFCAIIMERIDCRAGLRLLLPLTIIGIFSVVYWYYSQAQGRGDLRLYVDVQFYPMLAIPLIVYYFPSRYTLGEQVNTFVLLYGVAKLMEVFDKQIFNLTQGLVGGHALKHLVAAVATLWLIFMLQKRQHLPALAASSCR